MPANQTGNGGCRVIKPYYQDESATIYCGDCREILPQLAGQQFDLVLTDPPYGIGESSKKQATRGGRTGFNGKKRDRIIRPTDFGFNDWDKEPPSADILNTIIAKGRYSILWGGNFFGLPAASKWLVWDKDNSGDFADCELAWTNLPGAVRKFKWRWNGMLQEDMSRKEIRLHPTQKPLALMKWCIQQAKKAQTVLDPFMGSGTTLRAAKDLGLKSIGIEIERKYCDIAIERLRQESLLPMMEVAA